MIEYKVVKSIMNFYEIYDYENYDVENVTSDNIRIKNIKTGQFINLRY